MAFCCLTHIFTTTASTPNSTHTGVIHHPSTFSQTSNMASKVFAPSLLTGTAYREHLASSNRHRDKTTEEEGKIRDSWVPESDLRDGGEWHVGFERATQMVVRRKGRGAFNFEGAMMEGWGGDIKDEEGRYGVGRLEDGFEYRGWVDEEMATVSTGEVDGGVVESEIVHQDEEEVEIESRNAMEGKRESVGRALFWNKF